MKIDPFKHKRKVVACNLLTLTRKYRYTPISDPPCISFEELKVPFQWCGLLDLREAGICTMGSTNDGKAGVVLRRAYADMSNGEFLESYKRLVERRNETEEDIPQL